MYTSLLTQAPVLLQQDGSGAAVAGSCFGSLVGLAVAVLVIAGMWKVFVKAGKPGWASLIPFYNIWVMLEVVGREGWWLILFLIPFVNIIVGIIVMLDLAKSFAKGVGFAIGLMLVPIIFFPILGFGDAEYVGPAAAK